jgi:hypothetical protein
MNYLPQEQAAQIWIFECSYQEIKLEAGYPWLFLILELGFNSILGLHLDYKWPSEKSFLLSFRDAILLESQKRVISRATTDALYIPQKIVFVKSGYAFGRLKRISERLNFELHPLSSEEYLLQCNHKNQHYEALDKDLLSQLPGWTGGEISTKHQVNESHLLSISELKKRISTFFFSDYNYRVGFGTRDKARFDCWENCTSDSKMSLSRVDLENIFMLSQ